MSCRALILLPLALVLACPESVWSQPADRTDSLLAREPETPSEMYDAAVTMLKLERPALARQYLEALLAAQPDDATLLSLRDKYGTTMFVQMARIEALQPAGGTLLDMLATAAENQLADPAFQESLVQSLTGTLKEREAALGLLRALGSQAVPLVIRRLAAGATPEEEAHLAQALLRMGRAAAPPLEAALYAPSHALQAQAADLLGRLGVESSLRPLMQVTFDPATPDVVRLAARRAAARIQFGSPERAAQVTGFRMQERLQAEALEHFSRRYEWERNAEGLVSLWTWDTAAGTTVEHLVTPDAASLYTGERLAREALSLNPDNAQSQALLLGFRMWRDVEAAGWDKPAPQGPGTAHNLGLALGPEVTQGVVSLSLEHNNVAAGLVALSVLGQTGTRSTVLVEGSPLIKSLQSPSWRLQLAAAEAVMLLDPSQPFPGSGQVVEILARALNSASHAKTVVIDPNAERGAAIGGLMSTIGYEPTLAPTGQEGFQLATGTGNVELAVLHLNTVRWELSQTIANLRADPRTARMPIAVYGPPELRQATEVKLRPYQLVSYLDDAGDPGLLRSQLEPLIAQRTTPERTDEQRAADAQTAAFWLRRIAEGHRTQVFPLEPVENALSEAVNRTATARDALIALGSIGRSSVQSRLADVGLSEGQGTEIRLTAVVQLAVHIQKFGALLDNDRRRQIEQALRSEQDPDLQTAWSAVVGALKPGVPAVGAELLKQPLPAQPLQQGYHSDG